MTVIGFCVLWRRRLGGYLDGALSPTGNRRVEGHLANCSGCQREVVELRRLRGLLASTAVPLEPEPDWSRFWPGIRARILEEGDRARVQSWRRRLSQPLAAHPRLAFGSLVAALALLALFSWQGISWWGGPRPAEAVTVHSVEAEDPDATVMVFTSADKALTVVWVFGPDQELSR